MHKIIGRWSHSSLSQVSFIIIYSQTVFLPLPVLYHLTVFSKSKSYVILYFKTWAICVVEDRDVKYAMASYDVTSHFSIMLEPIASASFLSSLSIIHTGSRSFLFVFFAFFFLSMALYTDQIFYRNHLHFWNIWTANSYSRCLPVGILHSL